MDQRVSLMMTLHKVSQERQSIDGTWHLQEGDLLLRRDGQSHEACEPQTVSYDHLPQKFLAGERGAVRSCQELSGGSFFYKVKIQCLDPNANRWEALHLHAKAMRGNGCMHTQPDCQ